MQVLKWQIKGQTKASQESVLSDAVMGALNILLLVALLCPMSWGQSIFSGRNVPLFIRLRFLGSTLDMDNNGLFSNEEIVADLTRNDRNSDGCLTPEEWTDGWLWLGFSREFAKQFYDINHQPGNDTSNCTGFSVENIKNNPDDSPQAMEDVLDNIIQSIINMCEAEHILYVTNNDCSMLPPLCRSPPYACRNTCEVYTFITSADRGAPFGSYDDGSSGSFARKLRNLLTSVDENSDGTITATEVQDDLETYYDVNNDSCVDELEFKARMIVRACGGYGFSEEFTNARFEALRNSDSSNSCDGISTAVPETTQVSADDFNSANLEILIDLCERDLGSYSTIVDCRSLPEACRSDRLNQNPVCQQYLQLTDGREGFPFEDARQIFRDLLAGFRNESLVLDLFEF